MFFFGHIKRHDTIIKEILESKVEGKKGRGRPRAAWPDNIINKVSKFISIAIKLVFHDHINKGEGTFFLIGQRALIM